MMKTISRAVSLTVLSAVCAVTTLSGCASGGYKLTREYAGFVNKQNVILRVILYVFTGVVFAVTLLVDAVVNNTIDFWEGRVSQGTFTFEEGKETYVVRHRLAPESQLRESHIRVFNDKGAQVKEVLIREIPSHEVEVFVNGSLLGTYADIPSQQLAMR